MSGALQVAPFFPASNMMFYVGTFIGERLLYCPSIGFCLLSAEAFMGGLRWAQNRRRCRCAHRLVWGLVALAACGGKACL